MNSHDDWHASEAWRRTLGKIISVGKPVSPRGMSTLELLHHTIVVDMMNPVVLCPLRKLSYRFLAAEALWILNGDDTVAGIAQYNPNIAQFSDDGVRFFGAYGPRIVSQLFYVVDKLLSDKDTRQAVLTTWRPNPPQTKDMPCTVAMAFSIRDGKLHNHVFMRSSDAWLGLPYDIFNFSMVALKVACMYNAPVLVDSGPPPKNPVSLGHLHLTMASSHLYARNHEPATACLSDATPMGEPIREKHVLDGNWDYFEIALRGCRDGHSEGHWRIRP